MPGKVNVIDHPLVQHKLTLMRSRETSTSTFRNLLREISMLLAYEVCRDMQTTSIQIETPIAPTMAPVLDGKKIVIISVLRAGNGILDGMLEILPSARVASIIQAGGFEPPVQFFQAGLMHGWFARRASGKAS